VKHNEKKQDWRFRIANREAIIGVVLAIFNFIWWYGFAYGLGSKPPEEYSYVFGFPAWIFYSLILGTLVMFALVFIVVKFFLTDVPLDDEEETEEKEEVRNV